VDIVIAMLRSERARVACSIASIVAFVIANDVLAASFAWREETRHAWAAAIALPYIVTMGAAILGGACLVSIAAGRMSRGAWGRTLAIACAAAGATAWVAASGIRANEALYVLVPLAVIASLSALFAAGMLLGHVIVRRFVDRGADERERERVPGAQVVRR
jgi:hypothetical protein